MSETRRMAIVTAPGQVELQERPLPELGPTDVRIRVEAATLCGSDLHIFKGKHPAAALPVAVGHELAGQVEAVGPQVRSIQPGQRIAVEPVIACGVCYFCQRGEYHLCTDISFQYRRGQGGLTTHFVVDERWAHPLPDSLSYAEGALLEPLAVALHAVRRSDFRLGQRAAIFGDGAIALFVLQVLRASGASGLYLAGVNEFRLAKAQGWGASAVYHNLEEDAVTEIVAATDDLGVERAFEAVGLPATLRQSLQVLRKGGLAVQLGLFEKPEVSLPGNLFVQREIGLVGSQGYCWDFQAALDLVQRGLLDLGGMLTHEYALDEVQAAFETALDPAAKTVKVVVRTAD